MSAKRTIDTLVQLFSSHPAMAELSRRIACGEQVTVTGTANAARSMLAAGLTNRLQRPVVLVLKDNSDTSQTVSDLRTMHPEAKHIVLDPDLTMSLNEMSELNVPGVIITTCKNLKSYAPEPVPTEKLILFLRLNQSHTIESFIKWLEEADYERVDLVTESGEYATRGGIVDVFPEKHEQPVRVEFLDDILISLRKFDPLSQRSIKRINTTEIHTLWQPRPSHRTAAELLPDSSVIISEAPLSNIVPSVRITHDAEADLDFGCSRMPSYLGNFRLLRSEMETSGHRYFIACNTQERCARIKSLLGDKPTYIIGNISSGFTNPGANYTLLTECELYGTPYRKTIRHRFKGVPIDNLITLRPGDYIVHINYGIGRFEGTRRFSYEGIEKDYIALRYAGDDRVYVPIENLGLLDRYIGTKDTPPRLDRIGGRSWLLAKARAARASAEYAQELLAIQARRSLARGNAFVHDSEWQAELEASFPYLETPDQFDTLASVKKDMENHRPMERLVCGDVGYGKTEIALRAALKATSSMKQVALLVPTTVLCYQHYTTFCQRLKPFPLHIEMLSRLVTPARRKQILADTAAGKVDIIISTHLLLGSKMKFRDLGLLIIDEEQKFGVRQKEQIKQLKASVDVLILTATPVPRTLYLALAGLQDISTIHTPPAGRREVQTEIAPWDDNLIVKYVMREINRGGQVFFVHNRIASIRSVANRLHRLFPGFDIALAHGRMRSCKLEQMYLDFAAGKHQILLSTAIVESGLDMPNVNTIIVNRADMFGLSDLHQLRGRVGRSGRQAYALFLVPLRREITHEARKRLSALLAYSRLGSGFKLALRDLEIRGAGDLLGTRQHGHVARIGLALYAEMLKEATAHIRGETVQPEPELSLEANAFLPGKYVPDAFERVALYRRLLGLESRTELEEFKEELIDRFGHYPHVVENLFKIALVRIHARRLGLLKVTLKAGKATVVGPNKTTTFDSDIDKLLARLSA